MKGKESAGQPRTAMIYARTSSDDADRQRTIARGTRDERVRDIRRKESIELQIQMCKDLCSKHDLAIKGTYSDRGYSGRTYPLGYDIPDNDVEDYYELHIQRPNKKYRPGFGELLRSDPPPDVIVARDISRICRKFKNSHIPNHLWQIFARKGIKFLTVEEGFLDQERFLDRIIIDLKMSMEDDVKQKEIERCRLQLKKNKDSGYLVTGATLYGFEPLRTRGPDDKPKALPVPHELAVVRLIYDKYLAGTKLQQIARFLNDERKAKTRHGELWSVNQVRKVLLRPWYAGLQYNSVMQIIPSISFPSGDDAVVKPEEFHAVAADFAKRKKKTVRNIDVSCGPPIGSTGRCHPFSGLVYCGNCNRALYIFHGLIDLYEIGKPVETWHYICKTPQITKDKQYKQCRKSRIREVYPQEALKAGVRPNGYGLVEALFPLMIDGLIQYQIDSAESNQSIVRDRQKLEHDLDRIRVEEKEMLNLFRKGLMDEEQYGDALKDTRERKSNARNQLAQIQQRTELQRAATLPDKVFLDPKEIDPEVIRDAAWATFERIVVYPDRITVKLKSKDKGDQKSNDETGGPSRQFDLRRIRVRNSRDLPFWKARINETTITRDTKVGVTYYYPSTKVDLYGTVDVLLNTPRLEVITVGEVISLDKWRNKNIPKRPSFFDGHMKELFGDPPGYGRTLEVNSNVFFGPLIDPSREKAVKVVEYMDA